MDDAATGICATLDTSQAGYKKLVDKWGQLGTSSRVRSSEIAAADTVTGEIRCILHGWAFRSRGLHDGRRVVRNFLIPGDMIGGPTESWPRPFGEVLAASDLECVTILPEVINRDEEQKAKLKGQLDASLMTEMAILNGQAMRLGGMTMAERTIHLFLELLERHRHAELTGDNRFWFPIPQDLLADCLGVSRVHLNRTLQHLRSDGVIRLEGAALELKNVSELARRVEYESLYHEPALPL